MTVVNPDHSIAINLPKEITTLMTEMYDEPFHVATPHKVVFEESWKTGEHFQSGSLWKSGKGQVFYFRPGHETYPILQQPEMIQMLAKAC